jgi:hypothetical protein
MGKENIILSHKSYPAENMGPTISQHFYSQVTTYEATVITLQKSAQYSSEAKKECNNTK